MSMHLFTHTPTLPQASSADNQDSRIQLLSAYENGSVTLWRYTRTDKLTSVEGIGWEALWSVKLHVESGLPFRFSSRTFQ
jgi:ASTRA-associated protein 1